MYTFDFFHIVGNHIVGYVNDTTIYAVIPGPLSRRQLMESLNQDLAVINSWCLTWHIMLNLKKTKSIAVSQSRISASGNGNLTLGGTELEEAKSLCILGVTFDSNSTLEIYLRDVLSKAASNLEVVRREGKLFDCSRVLKGCFNAYVFYRLEYCAPVWMLSAESHLGLLDSIVRGAERLCEGVICCYVAQKEG